MTTIYAETFTHMAETQLGGRYVYGAEVSPTDPDPVGHGMAFDCSELVQWAADISGGYMPDGTSGQLAWCKKNNTLIDVFDAFHIRGAVVGIETSGEQHIVISRGDNTTIEARGAAYGVVEYTLKNRPWNWAALIPGMTYGPLPEAPKQEEIEVIFYVGADGAPALYWYYPEANQGKGFKTGIPSLKDLDEAKASGAKVVPQKMSLDSLKAIPNLATGQPGL